MEEHAPNNNKQQILTKVDRKDSCRSSRSSVSSISMEVTSVNKLICALYMMFESHPLNLLFNIRSLKACALQTTTCCLLNANKNASFLFCCPCGVLNCSGPYWITCTTSCTKTTESSLSCVMLGVRLACGRNLTFLWKFDFVNVWRIS